MSVLLQSFSVVIPIFLIILCGYIFRFFNFFDSHFVDQSYNIIYYFCLPILLFYKIGSKEILDHVSYSLIIALGLTIIIIFILANLLERLKSLNPPEGGTLIQSSFRGNLAYIALSIIYLNYGDKGLAIGAIAIGFLALLINILAIFAFVQRSEEKDIVHLVATIFKNPIVLSCLAGIGWSFSGIGFRAVFGDFFQFISQMTLPFALFIVGASFQYVNLREYLPIAVWSSIFKLIIMPGVACGFLYVFDVGSLVFTVGIILAAAPSAAVTSIFAQKLGGDTTLSSTIVIFSTTASLFTYPFWLTAVEIVQQI